MALPPTPYMGLLLILQACLLCVVRAAPVFTVTPTETTISISWIGDDTTPIGNYKINVGSIEARAGPGTDFLTDGTLTDIITNLSPGLQYEVIVYDTSTATILELYKETVTMLPRAPILDPIAESSVTTNSIALSWQNPPDSTHALISITFTDNSVSTVTIQSKSVNSPGTGVTLDGLLSGHNYSISLVAVSGTTPSKEVKIIENTRPVAPNITELKARDTTRLLLQWVPGASIQSSYEVTYESTSGGSPVQVVPGCTSSPCDINVDSQFIPGSQFNVKVYAVEGKWKSAEASKSANTQPLEPGPVSLTARSVNSINIQWAEPVGSSLTGFDVQVDPDVGTVTSPSKGSTNVWTYLRSGLQSGNQYTFSVFTVSGDEKSTPQNIIVYTKPPLPARPTRKLDGTTITTLGLVWSAPTAVGEFDKYRVSLVHKGTGIEPPNSGSPREVPQSARETSFNNLQPGALYTVTIVTVISDVTSDDITAEFRTRPLPPRNLVIEKEERQLVARWDPPDSSSTPNQHTGFQARIVNVQTSTKTIASGSTMEAVFTDLLAGTEYIVEVWTVSDDQQSDPVSETVHTKPKAPQNLRKVDETTNQISVEWDAPTDGTYEAFTVSLLLNDAVEQQRNLNKTVTNYDFIGLLVATQYSVTVVSRSGNEISSQAKITVATKPNPPTNLLATSVSEQDLTVQWNAPVGFTVDQYKHVLTKVGEGSPHEQGTINNSPTQKNWFGLNPGSSYNLNLFVVKYGVESQAASLDVTMAPKPPASVTEEYRGQTSLKVNWVGPTGSDYDEFVIIARMKIDNREVARETVPRTTTSYEILNLSPGVQYTVDIFTSSSQVQSLTAATINLDTLPSSVGSIEVQGITSDSIQVTWQEPDSAATFVKYELTISPNDGTLNLPVEIDRDAARDYTFLSLRAGVEYSVNIQTVTASGSKSDPVTRVITTKPSSVTSLVSQTQGVSTIVVRWSAGPGSLQDNFVVEHKTVEGGSVEPFTKAFIPGTEEYSHNLQDLLPGHSYLISVVAQKGDVSSEEISITGTTVPRAVIGLTAEATGPTAVKLSWSTADDSRQDEYKIKFKGEQINLNWSPEQETTSNPYSVQGLFPGERYTFEVKAVSQGNIGDAATTKHNALPLPPTDLAVDGSSQASTTSVTLVWNHDSSKGYVMEWKVRYTKQGTDSWEEAWVSSATDMQKRLDGLTPGQKYDVQVFGATQGRVLSQNPAAIVAIPLPQINSDLHEVDTTNETVAFNFTRNTIGVFDYYRFTIDPDQAVRNVNRGTADFDDNGRSQIIFDQRKPGNIYTVTAQVVTDAASGVKESLPVVLQIVTRPNIPIVQTDQSSRQIEVVISKSLDEPRALVDQYEIICEGTGCSPRSQILIASDDVVRYTYTNLTPFTRYTFKVKAIREAKSSAMVVREADTREAAPGPVQVFRVTKLEPYEVTLAWETPTERNGNLQYYSISYRGIKSGSTHSGQRNVSALEATEVTLSDLKAGYMYDFTIRAHTIAGGQETTIKKTLPIGRPFRALQKWEDSKPKMVNDNDTMLTHESVTLEFIDPFSDKNGAVVSYTVIVTGDITDQSGNDGPSLESWLVVQGKPQGTPYQATEHCPDFFSSSSNCGGTSSTRTKRSFGDKVLFTVGAGTDCAKTGGFCNGPLKPDSTYYFKLRGFTENQDFDDTDYSDPVKTKKAPNSIVLIAVLVTLALVIALAVILVLIVLVRRGYICNHADHTKPTTEVPFRRSMRMSSRKKRLGETSRPMKLVEFGDHVKKMSADSDFRFSEEYDDLKQVGREQSTNAADLPVNRNKNRFTNILPYDHSRVKLLPTDDEEGSDYINANYMPGYNSKREFIVTQGPLPSTRDDMWRMVWEQHARAIVMLTRCVEKGREKCDHYWPVDSEPMFYGDLQVTILHETKCPDWIVTEFRVSKGESSSNVKHFHYIGWPDFGVPEKPQTLIQFVRLVRSKLSPEGGPIIVHCSAGVGRSGTYIALDKILQELRDKKAAVDIFGTVYEMRMYRPQMVQTEQQYICIHNCLQCVLDGREDDVINYGGEENEAFDDKNPSPLGSASGALSPSNVHTDDDEGITMEPN